ncbi:MAG TPA: tetratricopeptide repeat protein [Terriglobia bacterium]|nr:tetratricopeptide repeat protein [Terriglobia bacterium]
MKLSVKILSILAGMLMILPLYAQTGQGIISGKVTGRDGMPAPNVVVHIDRMNSLNANQKVVAQRFDTKTGRNGGYSYNGLPPGSYVVTIDEGGRPLMVLGDQVGNVITVADGREATASFDMRNAPPPAAAGTPGGPPPSKEAIEADRKAMEEAAKNKGIRDKAFAAGKAAYAMGDYQEAVNQFTIVTVADPKQDVAFANLGNSYHQLKKEDEAVAAYQKAIALKPMEAAYHNNLGLSLGAMKKLDDAKSSFEMAASLDPMKAGDYLFNEGAMYNNNGDYPKAVEAFKKTLDKDPNNKSALLQIAISFMGTEATMPQAVPYLEKFLTLKPSASDADMAHAFLDAIKTPATTEYKSDKALADEKKAAEKKAADDAKAAASKSKAGTTKKN